MSRTLLIVHPALFYPRSAQSYMLAIASPTASKRRNRRHHHHLDNCLCFGDSSYLVHRRCRHIHTREGKSIFGQRPPKWLMTYGTAQGDSTFPLTFQALWLSSRPSGWPLRPPGWLPDPLAGLRCPLGSLQNFSSLLAGHPVPQAGLTCPLAGLQNLNLAF